MVTAINCSIICKLSSINNNNNNKFHFYVIQFSGLAQTASHKKKKEFIDKEIIIVQAKNTKLLYLNKIIIVKFK